MFKHFTILILFNLQISIAQTTTYKNKSGNIIGHSKQNGNTTTYYNKAGNKTCSSKHSGNGTTTFYNKQGNKISTSKTK